MGAGRKAVAALLVLTASASALATGKPQIQFAEKIALSARTGRVEFDAYGRRFALTLAGNDRALGRLKLAQPKTLSDYRLWRGTLDGQPGSWTRLTEHAGHLEGVIWDGRDLYAVTRYAEIADYLSAPLAAQPEETVVFRLSDTINFLPSGYCAVEASAQGLATNNGLVQYRAMVAELQTLAAAGPTQQIEISMIADSALQAQIGDPTEQMVSSYNIVDGIYAEQVGLLIVPADMRTIPSTNDPFTATDPSTLLGQVSTYRQNTAAISSLGIVHLLTGHDLDGDVIGIARLGGACNVDDGVSLSEGALGISTALVMAHEIGHNLGAVHDGTGACASVPETFLMAPHLNASSTFSQCSLDAMSTFLASASCITPAVYAHVELPQTSLLFQGDNESSLVIPFELRSTGTRTADGVKLDLRLNESLALTAVTPGVTCTPETLGLSCDVGSIPAGVTRLVELTLLPSMQGTFLISATVSATNNQNTRNSTQTGQLNVLPSVDASVSVTTSKSTANFGDPVDVTITVKSLKTHTARDVRVGVFGGGLNGISTDVTGGGSCQLNAVNEGQTFCILGDMDSGTTRQIVVHSTASLVGASLPGTVYLSSTNDTDSTNNYAYFTMRVDSVHDVGLEDVTPLTPVQYNMPYEYKANLHSYGSQSVDAARLDVLLSMQDPAALNSVSSVTVGGVACNKLANWNYRCDVGTMAAGEVRPVSVKGIATGLGQMTFDLQAYAPSQDDSSNDRIYRGLIVRYGLDASVTGGSPLNLIEGLENYGSFAVWSNGVQATSNAVLNVALPAQAHFTKVSPRYPETTSCSIVDPQHLRCVYNIPPASSYQDVNYFVVGDVPGSYQATATLTLAGDEDPTNNSVQWPVTIDAALDVGLRSFSVPQYVIAGHDVTVPLTVFTGSRAVAGATATIYTYSNADIVSLSTGVGACSRIDPQRFNCDFGDLPGGSTWNLSAVVTARAPFGYAQFTASVQAPGENVGSNNGSSVSFTTAPTGDTRVEVANSAVSGTAGAEFSLPSISVWRAGELIKGRLQIVLPPGVSLTSVSSSVFACTGTTTLDCELPNSWPETQALQFDLKVSAAAATTGTVTASVTALNDFTPGNDQASIAVTVNAAAPPPVVNPPPPNNNSSSGGGGGGRFEWLALAVLTLLAARRIPRRRMR